MGLFLFRDENHYNSFLNFDSIGNIGLYGYVFGQEYLKKYNLLIRNI